MGNGTYTSSPGGSLVTTLGGYVVSLVFIVGIFVLIALHDLSATTGIPLAAIIGGVHAGATITQNAPAPASG